MITPAARLANLELKVKEVSESFGVGFWFRLG